jgi:hypothetical protein
MRTFAGEVATFAMDERTCTGAGGRQPPVVHGNARAAAWRNCSGNIRPTHWRAPAQSRYSHTHGGLTPAALVLECERLPAKLRLLRWTNAHASGAGGVSPPGSRNRTCKGFAPMSVRLPTVHQRQTRSAILVAPLRLQFGTFRQTDTAHAQERGASAPRGSRQRTCKGFASRSARLPTVHQRSPTQSRYYILDNIHGGLTRGALALGESLPACAWRFLLHARSPNHGGLTPAALVSECERLPAKLRLLRCTNACAPGAGGVSPPWFTVTHVQGRGAIVRGTSDQRTVERQRSHGTTTSTAGSRAPLLRWANRCLLVRGDFPCTRVLGTTAGSRPPLLRRNANVCLRNCDFCDARTHMHQERGVSAPRGSRNRTGKGVRLLRCKNACAPGAGGVSPPWFTVTHVQGRGAIVRGTSDQRTVERQRSHGTTTSTAGSRAPLLRWANRRLLVRGGFPCARVLLTTAGSRPPLLCRNANVCRRNCDFCDARTHVHQERGASAPRGSRQRTCKCVRVTVSATADRAPAISDAFAILHVWEPAAVPKILQRASADSDAVAVLHPRQHPRRADARRSCVGRIAACLCVAISFARVFS